MEREAIIPRLQHAVAVAVLDGEHMDSINERIIDPAPLRDDAKAALWLYGWSLQEPDDQRRQARAILAGVDERLSIVSGD